MNIRLQQKKMKSVQTAEDCVVKKDKKGLMEISEEMNGSKRVKEAGEEQIDKLNTELGCCWETGAWERERQPGIGRGSLG